VGERVGRTWQGVALFAVGGLLGALLLGSGSISLPGMGDDAQAQGASTWSLATFSYCEHCPDPDFYSPLDPETRQPGVRISEVVGEIPSSCQVEPLVLADGSQIALFVSC
jgi:hypothetical protein